MQAADDIALLADDDNLQDMRNVLNDWCKVWNVYLDKSQIMHFRSASKLLTLFDLNIMENVW